MFSRGETRVSLAPSLFLCSSERENREARNECKRWSVGWSVARTDSAYNLRLASTFLFSWKITERRCAGKIDTLRPLFAADNKNGKKISPFPSPWKTRCLFLPPSLSLSLFRWSGVSQTFLLLLSEPVLLVERAPRVQSVTDCSRSRRETRWKKENAKILRQGGDELHLEQGQCHGGDEAFVCKTVPSAPRPFLPFLFPSLFSTGNRQHLCLSALGETRRSLYSFERLIPRVCRPIRRPVLFHPGRGIDFSTLLR